MLTQCVGFVQVYLVSIGSPAILKTQIDNEKSTTLFLCANFKTLIIISGNMMVQTECIEKPSSE